MIKVIYKNNKCTVTATKPILNSELAFYIYDKTTNKWIWVSASETVPVEE